MLATTRLSLALCAAAGVAVAAALAAYACLIPAARARNVKRPHLAADWLVLAWRTAGWIGFDRWLLTEARYDLRTVLLIGIPILGVLATMQIMSPDDWSRSPLAFLHAWFTSAQRIAGPRALSGALALVLLVHAVETGKFITGWIEDKNALRALANGSASDPQLGDPLFVSARRLPPSLNRLAWDSTTPFLSVLVTPDLKPARLVVDPSAGYFWLPCRTAKRSEAESRALPEETRRLVRLHACLHRPD